MSLSKVLPGGNWRFFVLVEGNSELIPKFVPVNCTNSRTI